MGQEKIASHAGHVRGIECERRCVEADDVGCEVADLPSRIFHTAERGAAQCGKADCDRIARSRVKRKGSRRSDETPVCACRAGDRGGLPVVDRAARHGQVADRDRAR